jgi:hypothetical protein
MSKLLLEMSAKNYLRGFGIAVSDEEPVSSCRIDSTGEESSVVMETPKFVYIMPVDGDEVIVRRRP